MAPPSRSNPSRKRKIDQSSESQDTEGGYISETPRKKAKILLNSSQKRALKTFIETTGFEKRLAASLLQSANWDLEAATDIYLATSGKVPTSANKAKLNKLFDQYRENATDEPDEINMDGTMKLLGDAGISLENVDLLIFSELVKSPSLGKLTRDEFISGMGLAKILDISEITTTVNKRQAELSSDRILLKNVYKHTFIVARPQGQKAVALDQAIEYWRLLFSKPSLAWSTSSTPWLDYWNSFLLEKWKKSVNKDMWDQLLLFAEKTLEDESLSWWSEDSAWPGVIDDFVAYVNDKRGTLGNNHGNEDGNNKIHGDRTGNNMMDMS